MWYTLWFVAGAIFGVAFMALIISGKQADEQWEKYKQR